MVTPWLALGLLLAPPASSPVYGTAEVPLTFAHARHADVPCATCHPGAAASARAGDRLLPTEATCFGCHPPPDAADPKGNDSADAAAWCGMCHPGYRPTALPADPRQTMLARPKPPAVEWPAAALTFGHRPHLARGATCADCHPGVEASTAASDRFLPTMGACLDCHRGAGASTRCATCHPAGPDGRLQTALPHGPLLPRGRFHPADHRGAFAVDHRAAATADPAYCAECHAEPSCDRCHHSREKPVGIHPFDYVRLHAIDARRAVDDCQSCHREQTFCLDCHVRSGVSIAPGPTTFGRGDGAARFHPPGFVGDALTPAGPAHHKHAARVELRACVSCHRESECVTCHGVGAAPGLAAPSPHPPGFGCGPLDAARRGCLKCHADPTALDRLCGR